MAKYDLVLFDMDGTLIGSGPSHRAMFRRFWETYYPQMVPEDKLEYLGNSLREIFLAVGFGEDRIDGVFDNLEDFYANQAEDIIGKMDYIPGTRETVEALRVGGVETGLVSNSMEFLVKKVAAHNGMEDSFNLIIGADRSFDHKAERFEKIKAQAGIPGGRILYVGDSEHDPQAAEQAGIDCCILYLPIGWMQSEENLMKNHMPDYIVKDISKIATIAL